MKHKAATQDCYYRLYTICSEFREKLDNCVKKHPNLFKCFPHGYCSHICIWAYDYLVSKGFTGIEFRINDPFLENMDGSHTWLYWNGYNIDLSCDQFNAFGENFDKVIIEKIEYNIDGEIKRTRYTPLNVTKSSRQIQVALEYNPLRILYAFPDSEQERNLIYEELGISFKYK